MSRLQDRSTRDFLRLGKEPAKRDARNLQLKALLRKKVALPREYDVDLNLRAMPTPMFGNDRFGCCVIAGRAHQTLRFEWVEQQRILPVTDDEVIDQYLRESGGADVGLVALDSLRAWRKQGWTVGGAWYTIRAFSEIDRTRIDEMKSAIVMNLGAGVGLSLPLSAQDEFTAGKPWTRTTGRGSAPRSWGGHYVYVTGYTTRGPVCVTWGRKQQMSWAFFRKYCDEAYAIIDAINTPEKRAMLDEAVLEAFLQTVSKPEKRRRRATKRAARPSSRVSRTGVTR